VLVGVARVDAALETPAAGGDELRPLPRATGLFLPERPLGSIGAKVALASRLGLIDASVERALNVLRKLRNAFAHSAESASLADPAHSSRLAEVYADARTNPLWTPLETVLAAQAALCPRTARARARDYILLIAIPGGLPGGNGTAAQSDAASGGDALFRVSAE
jgi:hypothetical protein